MKTIRPWLKAGQILISGSTKFLSDGKMLKLQLHRRQRHVFISKGVIAIALSALSAALQAQGVRPDTMLTVEIVGMLPQQGLGIDRALLPYPVQTATTRELTDRDADNLTAFMVNQLTGVNVNEISGSPFQNDITFRGFRASPVLGTSQGVSVYLDGVRVNEPFGDVVNWDMLPEAALSSLVLVPGSNPLYGLNTLGGALAFNTKSGDTDPGLEAGISYGSAGQRRSDIAYGWKGENHWHSFVAATLFDDRGWRDHSDGRLGNLFLKVGHKAGPTEWNLTLLGGRSRLIGNGLLPSYRLEDGTLTDGLYEQDRRAAYTFPDETENRLAQGAFNLRHQLSPDTELAASVYVRNSRRDTVNGDVNDDYADYASDCGAGFDAGGSARDPASCGFTQAEGAALHTASLNTSSTRQHGQGLSAVLSTTPGAHHVVSGATYDHSTVRYAQFEQAADFTAERSVVADDAQEREEDSSVAGAAATLGLFAADTWTVIPGLHLTASLRYNRARVSNALTTEGDPQARETFTYQKLNPSLGFVHDLGANISWFGNLSQNNRVPTVIELGCADPEQPCRLPVGLQSDPYLKQVVSRSVEAGLRWQPQRGDSLALSVYRTVNRDDILFRTAGLTQQGYFSNFPRTRHQGMDLSATKRFGPVDSRLSYSYLDATYDADGSLFTGTRNVQVRPGTRIAGLPRHTLKFSMEWKVSPAWRLATEVVATSNMVTQGNEDGLIADPEPGQEPQRADWSIRGHTLVSVRASYRPDERWELFARINNLTDKNYATYGALAMDMFPDGQLLQPHVAAQEASVARFLAPGAPRSVTAGLRYRF
jgi:outer membrane receptor protein involved in Fe transport